MSKKITLGLVAVLVLGGIWAAYSVIKSVATVPQTFIVGEEFIEHLADGDIDAAAALAVEDLQTEESKAALKALVEENAPLFDSSTEVQFTGRGIDNDIRYAYGTISSDAGSSFIYLEFVFEGDETRVRYLSFDEGDVPDYSTDDNGTATEEDEETPEEETTP